MWIVRHRIYRNSGEGKCGTRLEKVINIARHCLNSYSITAATAKSVSHLSFWWLVYVTTFHVQSERCKYAMRPVAWSAEAMQFSVRGYEVHSEPSELSGTPGCCQLKLGWLLMILNQDPNHSDCWTEYTHWNRCVARCYTRGVSKGSGPSLRVRVRIQTELLPNWCSQWSIDPNSPLGYGSMVNSQPVWIGWGVSGSIRGSIYRYISGSCICSLLIVSYQNRVFSNQWCAFACCAVCNID